MALQDVIDKALPATPAAAPAPSAPAASTPAPAAPAPSAAPSTNGQQTPAQTAEERRILKLKVDRNEEDFDWDEHWKDEKKREEAKGWLQTGKAHPRILQSEIKRNIEARDQWFLDSLKEQGIEWDTDDKVKLGIRLRAKAVATAAANPQDKEFADLVEKAKAGDPESILEVARRERKMDEEKRAADQRRADEETRTTRQKAEREQSISNAAVDAIEAHEAFKGLDEKIANPAKNVIFTMATELARSKNYPVESVPDLVTKAISAFEAVVNAKVAAKTPAAPKPLPVLGGAPPTKPTTTKHNSVSDLVDSFLAGRTG